MWIVYSAKREGVQGKGCGMTWMRVEQACKNGSAGGCSTDPRTCLSFTQCIEMVLPRYNIHNINLCSPSIRICIHVIFSMIYYYDNSIYGIICALTYMYMYICMYIYVHVHMDVYIYIYICMCVFIGIYIYMHSYILIYIWETLCSYWLKWGIWGDWVWLW